MGEESIRALQDAIDRATLQPRFRTVLLAAFSLLALFLAALGVYGILEQNVEQRTKEIGVRMALGGSPGNVFGSVLSAALRTTLIGIAIGLLGAVMVNRVLADLLFEITPADPLAFTITIVVIAAASCAGSYLPARHAARVDPMVALRYE